MTKTILRSTTATVALVCGLGAVVPAMAQTTVPGEAPSASVTYSFDVQDLATALTQLGQQARRSIIFDPGATVGKRAPKVDRAASFEDALRQLLRDSGLRYDLKPDGSAIVLRQDAAVRAAPPPVRAARVVDETPPEELVVVGSRLQGPGKTALPVTVIDQQKIQASGAQTLSEVLNDLPQTSVRSTTATSRGNTSVSLRGLPSGTSLVLVNGRRLTPSAYNSSSGTTTLGLLALGAVERIEVLPNGSSAVYGGDALAGVVNVVLKRNLEGGTADVRYGHADGYDETTYTVGYGMRFGRGAFSVLAQLDMNSELSSSERAITANPAAFGGPAPIRSSILAYPANISTRDGSNLPGLNSSRATVPVSSTGIGLRPSDFAATAGQINTGQVTGTGPQRPATKQYGFTGFGDYELTDGITAYVELFYSHRLSEERDFPYAATLATAAPLPIPANYVNNPFGVPLQFEYMFNGAGKFCFCVTQEYGRAVGGLRGTLGDWKWDTSVTWNKSRDSSLEDTIDANKVLAAMNDPNPATSFNPFQVRSWTASEVQRFAQNISDVSKTSSTLAQATIRGEPLRLPSGPVKLLLGAEFDHQTMNYRYTVTTATGDRDVASGLTELRVPVWSGEAEGDPDRLALQGALRYDRYSDFGSKLSKQGGIEVRPVKDLLVRASYSSAFKPPTLLQLHAPTTGPISQTLVDTARGREVYTTQIFQGGNPNLRPLTGSTVSYGGVLTPGWAPGVEFSIDRWTTKINDYSSVIAGQTMLDNEALFSQYITRAAPTAADIAAGRPGRVLRLQNVTLNFGKFDVAGIDVAARARIPTRYGEFLPSAVLTRMTRYRAALIPAVPATDRLGIATSGGYAPGWKAQLGLGWSTREVSATVNGRYVSEYADYAPSTRRLGDFWIIDAQVRFDVAEIFRSPIAQLRDTHLTIGARNLFDKLPVYSNYNVGFVGYDPSQYDIVGRFLYVGLGTKF